MLTKIVFTEGENVITNGSLSSYSHLMLPATPTINEPTEKKSSHREKYFRGSSKWPNLTMAHLKYEQNSVLMRSKSLLKTSVFAAYTLKPLLTRSYQWYEVTVPLLP